jgi:cellulose synthase/poly-beta-1,6-N-acetylglucosamine synthase-like glycosyltransferase
MIDILTKVYLLFIGALNDRTFWEFLIIFLPFILFIELPYYVILLIAGIKTYAQELFSRPKTAAYRPHISCLLTCYDEGYSIIRTLKSLREQLYRGQIEVLIIIDGAEVNQETVNAAQKFMRDYRSKNNIRFRVIPKRLRGGHASSINLGVKLAKGEVIITLDGDCSCDNDMVAAVAQSFNDPNVIGMSGTLRLRNATQNILTSLQGLEFMIGIHFARMALSQLNSLNNISGAFGAFRRDFLYKIGGWKNGSAEDFDMTIRLRAYFKRYPYMKLIHNKDAVVHTDGPSKWRGLFKQRLRWDGDIYYIAITRHWRAIRPKFLGWLGFISFVWDTLLLHMVLPFSMIFGFVYLFLFYSWSHILFILGITYVYYFFVGTVMFIAYWLLASERKRYDLQFVPMLLIKPLYHLVLRIWSAVAILSEMVLKTHRDSSMAPAWVNRKVH